MEGLHSSPMKSDIGRTACRSLLKAAGYSNEDIANPFIGIVNSWSNMFPGHCGLNQLSQAVADGVYAAGGTPFTFSTIAICDGLCNGMESMKYALPSREIIADSIEAVANAHSFDGLVFVCACDKIVPGMMMAACRLNLPCIFVNSGPMMPGKIGDRRIDLSSMGKVAADYMMGNITKEEYDHIENCALPGCGSCAGMYTANSMGCMTEILGLALPGNGTIPAVDAGRQRLARSSGRRVVELIREDFKPSDFISEETFKNAITLDMLIGCSTNTTLHLPAIAHEMEIIIDLEDFDRIGAKTPSVCHIAPAGEYYLSDLYEAGGVQAIMKEALDGGLLNGSCKTVTGLTLSEQLENVSVSNSDVIRPLSNPYLQSGGLTILRGNLAPEGAVIKANAVDKYMFHYMGTARVFNSEKEATAALMEGKFQKGDAIIVRYEGPKGGPGMQEMATLITTMQALGFDEGISLITDGRFSGITRGASIGHVCPEAFDGGPIALVEDGDTIEYDILNKELNILISDEEMSARKRRWIRPEPKYTKGYLAKYIKEVSPVSEGAVTNH